VQLRVALRAVKKCSALLRNVEMHLGAVESSLRAVEMRFAQLRSVEMHLRCS
jgi:hypothetical protein